MLYLWSKFIYQCVTTLPCCWPKQPQQRQKQNQNQNQNQDEEEKKEEPEDEEPTQKSELYDMFILQPETYKFNRYREMRYNIEFRLCLLKQAYLGIFDIIAIILGIPGLLLLSRTIAYLKCVRFMIDLMFKCSNNFVAKYGNIQHHHIWTCCIKNTMFGILDIFYLICGLIPAMITSPISLYHARKTYKYNVENRLIILAQNKNHDDRYKNGQYMDLLLQYNWNLRWVILKLGFWGFGNVLFAIINIFGFLRIPSVWRLYKSLLSTHGYLHKSFVKQRLTIYAAILKNVILCIIDIIFIILFIFNTLGLIRWYHTWNQWRRMRKIDHDQYAPKQAQGQNDNSEQKQDE